MTLVRSMTVLVVLGLALASVAVAQESAQEPRGKIRMLLRNTGEDPDARGRAGYAWARQGEHARFVLRTRNLDVGTYDLLVNGLVEGTFAVAPVADGTATAGGLRLGTGAGNLGFDPRGKQLAVVRDGVTYLAGTMASGRRDGHRRHRFGAPLDNVSESQPDARAGARYVHGHGRTRFLVGIRGGDAGVYELAVDGEIVGQIEVNEQGRGVAGFDTVPHRPGSRWELLTFRVLGKTIEVFGGGELIFTGRLPDHP